MDAVDRGGAAAATTSRRRGTTFTVRPYRAADTVEAAALFAACFPGRREPAEWAWKFDRVLTDPQPPFHVAEVEGRLAGMYPVRTLRMQLGDAVRVAAQPQDVCVHPDHRGGAMVRALRDANRRVETAAGVPLQFGFPTAAHLKFGRRFMQYVDVLALETWRCPLSAGLRLQRRLRGSPLAPVIRGLAAAVTARRPPRAATGVDIAAMPAFDSSADRLWERMRHRVRHAVVRDAAYLTWRYAEAPGRPFQALGARRDGHLEGYCVFRTDVVRSDGWRAGVVMDLVALDTTVTVSLVVAALAAMRQAGCVYALARTHPAMATATALAAAGFRHDEGEEPVLLTMAFYDPGLDVQSFVRAADWLVGFGDSDHAG